MPNQRWHKACQSYTVCKNLRSILRDVGVGSDVASYCDAESAWPCSNMLQNAKLLYTSVTPSNADHVLDFISPLFASTSQIIAKHFSRQQYEAPFPCPELEIDMYQPCLASSCSFYTNNPWERNCILYYRARHGRDTLNLNELAFLLDQDTNSLRTSLARAFRKLSHGALKETISRENRTDQVSRIRTDSVCMVCEKRIDAKRRHIIRDGFVYCSRACYMEKPVQILRLEEEFSLPIDKILFYCVDKFSNIKNMCAALGLGPRAFADFCSRFGVEIPKHKQ